MLQCFLTGSLQLPSVMAYVLTFGGPITPIKGIRNIRRFVPGLFMEFWRRLVFAECRLQGLGWGLPPGFTPLCTPNHRYPTEGQNWLTFSCAFVRDYMHILVYTYKYMARST